MFDELIRKLRQLEQGVKVPIQIPLDENGCFDRKCPWDECGVEFKVLFEDWEVKVREEAAYCPICRHESPATEWNTPSQAEYMEKAAMAHLMGVVDDGLRRDMERFNRQQPRGGLVRMSMSYKPSPKPILVPPDVADAMRQEFVCEACACRYSSVGAAFFCPACGHNSALTTFAKAVESVRTAIRSLPTITGAIKAAADADAAADAERQILENGLVKLVASFQRVAEATFLALPNASSFPIRRNLFQNLQESSDKWREATGKGYEDLLDAAEVSDLRKFFQQRHLLAHVEGIVDQQYIDRSGDHAYSVGKRLIIKDSAVLRLGDLVEKLAAGLRGL